MQINSVQPYNTTFGAKLKIINKDFDKNFFLNLSQKAKNIGLEYDVIELNYTEFQDKLENKAFGRKNLIEPSVQRISELFKGRYIPQGEDFGTDFFEKRLTSNEYKDIWKQEDNIAEKYLYILDKKYSV